jgi:hypothetical protein
MFAVNVKLKVSKTRSLTAIDLMPISFPEPAILGKEREALG